VADRGVERGSFFSKAADALSVAGERIGSIGASDSLGFISGSFHRGVGAFSDVN
jgi:hypothetical protein